MPRTQLQQQGFAEAGVGAGRQGITQADMVNEATLADEAMEEDVEQEGYGTSVYQCCELCR